MDTFSLNEQMRETLQRLEDIREGTQRKYEAGFSLFLDAETVAVLKKHLRSIPDFNDAFYGGYPDAERCMYGVWPEYEGELAEYPMDLLQIDCPAQKTLSHRDCLGSILGLGIKRELLGDILCDGQVFYVFIANKMTSYVLNNLTKIGNAGVKIKQISIADFIAPQPKTEKKGIFIMSNRLDAILAGALDLSRAKAAELIHAERVSVNHVLKTDISVKLNEKDLLSVRGFGRFRVGETGNQSRKGRTYLEIIRYI